MVLSKGIEWRKGLTCIKLKKMSPPNDLPTLILALNSIEL